VVQPGGLTLVFALHLVFTIKRCDVIITIADGLTTPDRNIL